MRHWVELTVVSAARAVAPCGQDTASFRRTVASAKQAVEREPQVVALVTAWHGPGVRVVVLPGRRLRRCAEEGVERASRGRRRISRGRASVVRVPVVPRAPRTVCRDVGE